MRSFTLLLLVCVLTSRAAAQITGPVALDVFLEQRVAEELAADGTILSRLGVALDVELVGDKLIVSLVDPGTRRAVASTKVDTIPDDREAAVAAITQVVANLTAQLARTAAPSETAAISAMEKRLRDEQVERKEREEHEHQYRQEAVYFGDSLAVFSNGTTTAVGTVRNAYQGEVKRRLSGAEFFEVIERPDLVDAYHRRRRNGWIGAIGGAAVMLGGTAGYAYGSEYYERRTCILNPTPQACETAENSREAEFEAERQKYKIGGAILMGVGAIGFTVGLYYLFQPNPVSERELYDLANAHNRKLREKYGLSVSEVSVAPYAEADGGGLLLSGRF